MEYTIIQCFHIIEYLNLIKVQTTPHITRVQAHIETKPSIKKLRIIWLRREIGEAILTGKEKLHSHGDNDLSADSDFFETNLAGELPIILKTEQYNKLSIVQGTMEEQFLRSSLISCICAP